MRGLFNNRNREPMSDERFNRAFVGCVIGIPLALLAVALVFEYLGYR